MAVKLHERGVFTWKEWAARLAAEIAAAGRTTTGRALRALAGRLERLVASKGLILDDELARRRDAWAQAAKESPHGQPIELRRGG